jgi:hypothetical protein
MRRSSRITRAATAGACGSTARSATAAADTVVNATYDWRPAPWMFAVYLMPFVLAGGL